MECRLGLLRLRALRRDGFEAGQLPGNLFGEFLMGQIGVADRTGVGRFSLEEELRLLQRLQCLGEVTGRCRDDLGERFLSGNMRDIALLHASVGVLDRFKIPAQPGYLVV